MSRSVAIDPLDHLAGKRALIVDDDDDARVLLRTALESHRVSVCEADSVDSALAELDASSFDLIVSDIGMPGKDGYFFVRALRKKPGGATIPAVALTSLARAQDRTQALLAGFDRHFVKPLQSSALMAGLASLLESRSGHLSSPT